ncbi:hypothetical protein AD998_15005 [bacterium 336/3]|nr:hypothetical protein AD998_15005 [bacterium 336/3]
MKRIFLNSIFVLAIFWLFSCERTIDVKLDQGETLLAVDGWITDENKQQSIRLSTTAPYFQNGKPPAITDAIVTLSDSDGNTEQLTHAGNGIYNINQIEGIVGNTYKLQIRWQGETYEAQTEITPNVPQIDSIVVKKEKRPNIPASKGEGYFLFYNGPENEGVGDNFRVKVYRNDSLMNRPDNIIIAEDQFVDGNYLSNLELNNGDPFRVGDKLKVEVLSITRDAFNFYNELILQTQNGGLFANPPSNVRTNILNINPKGKKAVGYFGGASVISMLGKIEGDGQVIK